MELLNLWLERVYYCDFVIYIFKGILIVYVKFYSELWDEMFEKLVIFFFEVDGLGIFLLLYI